ncbi:TBL3 protein, partial [Atractosteus spatula]|nr:TBL3 protein [Atractosteus spatula]
QISTDENYIFCTCGTRVNVLEIATGKVIQRIEQDDQEDITSFTLSPDDEVLVTASRALLLKQWDWRESRCVRTWRAIHTSPVASMTFDPTSTLLATGGCDGTIKLWDVVKQYCTHNLKGSPGVVHLVQFHPDSALLQLFSSSMDCRIRVWDLRTSQCLCVLESHYSAVTSLAFTPDGSTLVSSGRDKICTVWDLKSKTPTRTVPVFEAVEAVVLLPQGADVSRIGVKNEGLHFITAGSRGMLQVWEASSGRCIFTQTLPAEHPTGKAESDDGDEHSFTCCHPLPSSSRVAAVTAEHNFLLYDLPSLTLQQQFVGYSDDILDVKFLGPEDSHIVVATNSPQLKVFELASSSCQILYGHTEVLGQVADQLCFPMPSPSLVQFHPDSALLQLFSSSMDCRIRVWDLRTSQCLCVLESHYSAVTSLAFTPDGSTLVSSGRDKICTVWDLKSKTPTRTVPVFEAVEAVVLLPQGADVSRIGVKNEGLHFITAGSRGMLRVWEASSGRCIFTQTLPAEHPTGKAESDDGDEHSFTCCHPLPSSSRVAAVTAEHNFLLYDLPSLTLQQQFVGYSDDILDVKFLGPEDSHIVVATNSPQLKVFELASSSCQILYGHTDTVLSLDVFRKGCMFASCAKDNSIRVWRLSPATGQVCCVAQGLGHVNAVGSISCSRMKESFVASGSQDCTVKVWELPESLRSKEGGGVEALTARVTEKGHDKDVNSVAVSPNDKLLASGSQDRTTKLWALADLSLLGVFRGHRRGVWCVQFSPVDQVLATSSADGSVKLWGLQDFSCLKTFEGHDASVLKVIFVNRGTQLLSSGSDGLVKLWTIKTNECVKTLEAHQDKVWGLHSSRKDDLMVTGSADSCITIWKDVTEAELEEEQAKQEDQILK